MIFRKTALVLALGLTVTVMPAMTASAAEAVTDPVRICTVTDCTETGSHYHNRIHYTTSSMYTACNLDDCTITGVHDHDGITYGTCQTPGVCDVSGCDTTTVHTHDNCIYSGHSAGDGHCHTTSTSTVRTSGGHHGRGHHGRGHH